jgi:hypothetical protein
MVAPSRKHGLSSGLHDNADNDGTACAQGVWNGLASRDEGDKWIVVQVVSQATVTQWHPRKVSINQSWYMYTFLTLVG